MVTCLSELNDVHLIEERTPWIRPLILRQNQQSDLNSIGCRIVEWCILDKPGFYREAPFRTAGINSSDGAWNWFQKMLHLTITLVAIAQADGFEVFTHWLRVDTAGTANLDSTPIRRPKTPPSRRESAYALLSLRRNRLLREIDPDGRLTRI